MHSSSFPHGPDPDPAFRERAARDHDFPDDNSPDAKPSLAEAEASTEYQRPRTPNTANISSVRIPETALLVARLEAAIRRLTGDRVRGLRIDVSAESVTIAGRCATFYCKQQAQHAAMELLNQEALVNEIEVY
ncbi:MAG: BON domain-containing protein [Pirellulales bacterium]|nr:BON domain-containing protein [Pirellulales bacterium]